MPAQQLAEAVRTWGAARRRAGPLKKLGDNFKLVILSNADDSFLDDQRSELGADFHAVYTAEQARLYKPRYQAFEYMLDQLDAKPEDFLHVSSHTRYDLMPCDDLGFTQHWCCSTVAMTPMSPALRLHHREVPRRAQHAPRALTRAPQEAPVKLTPYWLDTATPSGDYRRNPVPERADIAIVGAGFTGLSAALEAAQHGASVVVLDAAHGGLGRLRPQRRDGHDRSRHRSRQGHQAVRPARGARDVPRSTTGPSTPSRSWSRTLHRLRLPTLRQADPGHERQAGRPDAQDPADARRPGRLPGDRRRQAGHPQRDRQRLLRRRHGGPAGRRASTSASSCTAWPRRGPGPGSRSVRERPGHRNWPPAPGGGHDVHTTRGVVACRPGPDRDQRLHRIADPLAQAADHPGRQLHHRDRAAAAGDGPADPAPPPAGLRQQDAHLLLPHHPGQPAALRRTGQVRAVQPRLGPEERRDPASAR